MKLAHKRGEQAILWQAISKKKANWRSLIPVLMWLFSAEINYIQSNFPGLLAHQRFCLD
ncbi:MAG: hypothetical protein WBG73_21280 [Coleofasciculaceae cyanobacterium]